MRVTQLFTKTRKQAPADEVALNAQLLIKAGYIHKEMAGVYAYLPLGLKVLENIKQIVREEMDAIGGQELIMTSLQRKEIWEHTDRWDDEKVDVWFKSKLQNGTEVGFGWSHEEPITEMMKNYVTSYKDLPVVVHQFQTKLRNEVRAKSGIMRGREFVMNDMYGYFYDEKKHLEFYEKSKEAYMNVYRRVGLGDITFITYASGGAFTKFSHEFQTLTDAGEDTLFQVPSTKAMFNEEITPSQAPPVTSNDDPKPMEEVEGKGLIGVEPLAKFLKIPVEKTTKTMLYKTDKGKLVAAAVRGGYNINEDKLKDILGVKSLQLADEGTVKRVTKAEIGYAGIINLPEDVEIIVDESCSNRTNFEMGANRTNYHSINVNWGRDLPEPKQYYDIKVAKKGDFHPETGEEYTVHKAAEVGNIFNFGTAKCDDVGLFVNDENGKLVSVYLGSYGIGVTRLMGVVAEHFADDRGLVWPANIAPATVYLARLGEDEAVVNAADQLYQDLEDAGIETLYDDRDVRAGEKFADADLLGIPYRLVVSAKSLQNGQVELKERTSSDVTMVGVEEVVKSLGKAK
ncbi:MAG: prolyl-tRNA synthetase [Patescibacteria group bacterium]|nr:prolyl-tRNA synthetase [Patescibacteria group bacterium]